MSGRNVKHLPPIQMYGSMRKHSFQCIGQHQESADLSKALPQRWAIIINQRDRAISAKHARV